MIDKLKINTGEKIVAGPFELVSYPCVDGFGPEEPRNPCAALLFRTKDRIGVKFAASGALPKNAAKMDNEKTWLTGDVMEFFIMPEGRDDYYEFHATPEGRRLQLHLPHYKLLGKMPFEDNLCDCGLEVKTHELTNDLWVGEMSVEIGKLGNWEVAKLWNCEVAKFEKLQKTEKKIPQFPNFPISQIRFCVSRYYYGNARDIEYSSYPPLPARGYHNPPKWKEVKTDIVV